MASQFFSSIVGDIRAKSGVPSQRAILESAIREKTLKLSGTLQLRSDEELSESTMDEFLSSADKYVQKLVNGIISTNIDDILGDGFSESEAGYVEVESVYGIRDRRGRIMSATSLAALLNVMLYKYVEELMGKPGLEWQTGRLAHSGRIERISPGYRPGAFASIVFTYMIYPYAVFEPDSGDPRGSIARSPTELFRAAIDNALADLLSPKSTRFYIEGPYG